MLSLTFPFKEDMGTSMKLLRLVLLQAFAVLLLASNERVGFASQSRHQCIHDSVSSMLKLCTRVAL